MHIEQGYDIDQDYGNNFENSSRSNDCGGDANDERDDNNEEDDIIGCGT